MAKKSNEDVLKTDNLCLTNIVEKQRTETQKYKTALENIFKELQKPGCVKCNIVHNFAGDALYGDGVQEKVRVPAANDACGDRTCVTCVHHNAKGNRPCGLCGFTHVHWKPKEAVPIAVEKECDTCLYRDRHSSWSPCNSCVDKDGRKPRT